MDYVAGEQSSVELGDEGFVISDQLERRRSRMDVECSAGGIDVHAFAPDKILCDIGFRMYQRDELGGFGMCHSPGGNVDAGANGRTSGCAGKVAAAGDTSARESPGGTYCMLGYG